MALATCASLARRRAVSCFMLTCLGLFTGRLFGLTVALLLEVPNFPSKTAALANAGRSAASFGSPILPTDPPVESPVNLSGALDAPNLEHGRMVDAVLQQLPVFPRRNAFGNLSNLNNIGGIVLAPSKTGTTTMQLSLMRALSHTGHSEVLHGHADSCMHNVYPGTSSISLKDVIERRLAVEATPIWWGVTYRDPVSRFVSHLAHLVRRQDPIPTDAKNNLFAEFYFRDLDFASATLGVDWQSVPYSTQTMVGGGVALRPGVNVLVATVEALAERTHLEALAKKLGLSDFKLDSRNEGTHASTTVVVSKLQLTEADVNKSFQVHTASLHHFYTADMVEILRRRACEKYCIA